MKFPDIKLNYPSGALAIEIIGVDSNIPESLQFGKSMLDLAFREIPRLQPLVNEFYEMYMRLRQ